MQFVLVIIFAAAGVNMMSEAGDFLGSYQGGRNLVEILLSKECRAFLTASLILLIAQTICPFFSENSWIGAIATYLIPALIGIPFSFAIFADEVSAILAVTYVVNYTLFFVAKQKADNMCA